MLPGWPPGLRFEEGMGDINGSFGINTLDDKIIIAHMFCFARGNFKFKKFDKKNCI